MGVWPVQIRQLLYSGVSNMKPDKGELERQRTFKVLLAPQSLSLRVTLHLSYLDSSPNFPI